MIWVLVRIREKVCITFRVIIKVVPQMRIRFRIRIMFWIRILTSD